MAPTTPAAFVAVALDVSVKVAIAAGVATVLARLLRRDTARARYRVWLGALVIALLATTLALVIGASAMDVAPLVLPRRAVPWSLSAMLAWVWAFGAIAHLARTAAGFAALALDDRRLSPAQDRPWRRDIDMARAALGLRTTVRVLYGRPDTVPMCWGILRATIVVPSAASQWSRRDRRAVVLHECAHLQRRDSLVMLAEEMVCAALWFNPAVWVIVRNLRRERELACDEAVVAAGVRPDAYARLLVELARGYRRTHALTHAIVRPSEMHTRVAALLADTPVRSPDSHYGPMLVAIVALILLTLTRIVTLDLPSRGDDLASRPGDSPASFRAGYFESDR